MLLRLGQEIDAKSFISLHQRVLEGFRKSDFLVVRCGTRAVGKEIMRVSEGVPYGAFGAMGMALKVGLEVYNNGRGTDAVSLRIGRDALGFFRIKDVAMWELPPYQREFEFFLRGV